MIDDVRGRRTSVPEALRAGPFTVVEARRHGVLLDMLRDRRTYRRLLHGVYAWTELPLTGQLWIDAAAKVLPPDAVFSHRTAARIWGIPVADDGLIHVTVTRSTTCPRFRRIRVHQTNEDLPWLPAAGQRVTPPERTFADLAVELGLVDLVVAGDRMLTDRLIDRNTLVRQVESAPRRRGTRMARSAVELVRPRVDSTAQTRLRLLVVLVGLPEPLVNTEVLLAGGTVRFTPALHYPQARLAIDPEPSPLGTDPGTEHLTGELHRRIVNRGWRLSTCDTTDLWRTGWSTVEQLHAVLRARHQPGTPEHISRTRVQSAIGTLMDASEVAWTRVPRQAPETELVGTGNLVGRDDGESVSPR